jgi:ubiquinol-cytochrome c reductase cytochrome c1 subunit
MKTYRFSSGWGKTLFTTLAIFFFPLALCAAGAVAPATGPDTSEAAIKRGEEIFRSSCQACHSLKYSGYEATMSAKDAQSAFGKVPPDLNLMTKARGGGSKGAAYIDALLVSFKDTPEKNSVFPNIAMPSPFAKDDPELARKAKDISAFLDYAADPSARERRNLGIYVLGYMILLTGLLYALNRRTWKGIGKHPS